MTLHPHERKSWQGFLDLLQPPSGYRLGAAIGTSFGLSIDALTAALLAMSDADGEALAAEPVAGVIALTRLRSKVRVLVHPGTISGPTRTGHGRFAALLDRMIVEVQPRAGLFHPKIWALRFERVGATAALPESRGRLVIASRNLSESTCFELGAAFDGIAAAEGESGTPFSADVADALREWLAAARVPVPDEVSRLPRYLKRLSLDVGPESEELLRLRWQGLGRQPLGTLLDRRVKRAVVVSPFVRPEFVSSVLANTDQLQLVSTLECLNALDETTFAALEARGKEQGSPALYHVTDVGEPEEGHIEGLHAKLVLLEDHRGKSVTFVGSANATGPGWGMGAPANVEAMVEIRPGIGLDHFLRDFVRESRTKVHPWIVEYERPAVIEPDDARELEREMLAALRHIAKVRFRLRYDAAARVLTMRRASNVTVPIQLSRAGVTFSVCPLLLTDRAGAWTALNELESESTFDEVDISDVTAFVAVRAQCKKPVLEYTRLVLGELNLSESLLDSRDDALREGILANADPVAVLTALVRGLASLRIDATGPRDRSTPGAASSIAQLLGQSSLEGLLQAVALEPGLVTEMRMLLASRCGEPFERLCEDLEAVLRRIHVEAQG